MMLARKWQQPENVAKGETKKTKSSLQVSNSQPSPSIEMTQPTKKDDTLYKPDWSLLPEELLHIISKKLDDCFDVIHARSVCHLWRSIFPFPSCLLRTSYSLPSFTEYGRQFKGASSCTLEKVPMFFFKVRAPPVVDGLLSEFFVGGINQDKSEDHIVPQSPLQCSVKVKIRESEPFLLNVLDCQILPMDYQYRMVGWDPNSLRTSFRGVAFLPLEKEGGKEFVVLIGYSHDLLVLRSSEMSWMQLEKISTHDCTGIATFRGRFYVTFHNRDVFVIDPCSLTATPLMPLELAPLMPTVRLESVTYLVPYGDVELFLVELIIPCGTGDLNISKLACRVSRLDEDAGKWAVATDLGDRVLLIGPPGNSSCSVKELPDGCGVSGNSFLFTFRSLRSIEYFYKYGVDTGNAEDNLNLWRYSRDTRVRFQW